MFSVSGAPLRPRHWRLQLAMGSAACLRSWLPVPAGRVFCLLAAGLTAVHLHWRRSLQADPANGPAFARAPFLVNRVSGRGPSPSDSQVQAVQTSSLGHADADATSLTYYGIVGAVILALVSRGAVRQARRGVRRAAGKVVCTASPASAGKASVTVSNVDFQRPVPAAVCPPTQPALAPATRSRDWAHGERAIGFSSMRHPDGTMAKPILVSEHAAPAPSALGVADVSARAVPEVTPSARCRLGCLGATRQGGRRARGRRMGATARAAAAREQQQRRRLGSKLQRQVFEPRVEAFDPSRLRTAIQVGQQSARNQRVAKGRECITLASGGAVSKGLSSTMTRSLRLVTDYGQRRSSPKISVKRDDYRGVGVRVSEP